MREDSGADRSLDAALGLAAEIEQACSAVVLDQPDVVRLAVATLLAGGHVLLEGTPGVGKTLLGKALARAVGGSFARIQGTSDLLPSDITGVSVYDPARAQWEFRPGPVFANVVLFDELNRATPRAQSALLEALAERQVTVDGEARLLPSTHLVLATQNPSDEVGTFAVPAGTRDRFAVTLRVEPPSRRAEIDIVLGSGGDAVLRSMAPAATIEGLAAARSAIGQVHVHPGVAEYVVDVAIATRDHPLVEHGASPRAAKVLLGVARALAVVAGRDFVTPDDVKHVARPVLAHRLSLRGGGTTEAAGALLTEVLCGLRVPVV